MTRRSTSSNASGGASCVRLVPKDVLRFDPDQRDRFFSAGFQDPPADTTARVREELAHLLHTATISHNACGFEELGHSARRIRRLAVQTGLPDLARAADHVLDCIVSYDSAALGATVARVHRLGLLALADLGG